VIHAEHADLAGRFATRGADKFRDAGFEADEEGLPVLPGASVILDCSAYARPDGGDHTILLGRVRRTRLGQAVPAVYFRRRFHGIATSSGSGESRTQPVPTTQGARP
jgi:flavin reductase ActVB